MTILLNIVLKFRLDFAYHAYIYAKDNHPYRTPTSGTAAIGSGLNTVSHFDWIDFVRVKWATCTCSTCSSDQFEHSSQKENTYAVKIFPKLTGLKRHDFI